MIVALVIMPLVESATAQTHSRKRTVLLTVLQLVANGSDAYYTNRAMRIYGPKFKEYDPLARPFTVNRTTLTISAAAGMAGTLAGERLLKRCGHERWAAALAYGDIAGHTAGTIFTAAHTR